MQSINPQNIMRIVNRRLHFCLSFSTNPLGLRVVYIILMARLCHVILWPFFPPSSKNKWSTGPPPKNTFSASLPLFSHFGYIVLVHFSLSSAISHLHRIHSQIQESLITFLCPHYFSSPKRRSFSFLWACRVLPLPGQLHRMSIRVGFWLDSSHIDDQIT